MHPNLISLAVPVFFAAIIAEAITDRVRKRRRTDSDTRSPI